MRKVNKYKNMSVHRSAARNEERPSSRIRTVYQPLVTQPVAKKTLCSSIGSHTISFVRACEQTFRTIVLDALEALESKKDGCLLGKPTGRRPVLPRPAPLPRRAPPRPDPPVVYQVWNREFYQTVFLSDGSDDRERWVLRSRTLQ